MRKLKATSLGVELRDKNKKGFTVKSVLWWVAFLVAGFTGVGFAFAGSETAEWVMVGVMICLLLFRAVLQRSGGKAKTPPDALRATRGKPR